MGPRHFYEFGPYRLDASERLLYVSGRLVPLPPKLVSTLLVLIENRGHMVEKDELLKAVWAETFVEEGSLSRNIYILRKTLSDGHDGREYIETIPKRGYRFVAPVREIVETSRAAAVTAGAASPASPRASPVEADTRPLLPGAWRRRLMWIAPLATLTLSLAAYFAWHHFSLRPTLAARRVMLAVLPVQNLTGDPEREYISDGLTEEMIVQLGSFNPQRLGVIARTSSMAYKKTDKTVEKIGRELGVDYVLETSLRSSGDRLRVTTQLIRSRDQTHVWAREYDRRINDIVALQDDFSRAIAEQIQVHLAPQEQGRLASARPVNPQAYDAYLKGRFFWNKRTPEAMNTAVKYFQQAIETDPNYAPGYVGLADCDQLLVYFGQLSPSDGFTRARVAAQKALVLDSRLAEAHTTLASIKGDFDWDWPGAEAEYKRALELNSSYATAHHWYAEFLAGNGRLEEATAEIKRAQETDPLSPVIATTLGEMYCRRGQCDKAAEQYKKVLEMYPGFPQAQYLLAEAYARMGMYEKAVAEVKRAERGQHLGAGWASITLAYAAAMSGRRQEALNLVERVKKETDPQHVDYNLAFIYASLGEKDLAFERLEGALRSHDFSLVLVQADYRLDSLRSDARYKDLLHRMNLPL